DVANAQKPLAVSRPAQQQLERTSGLGERPGNWYDIGIPPVSFAIGTSVVSRRPDRPGGGGVGMTSLAEILNTLDPEDNLPLYQQLQRGIREAIEKRILGPDDALPSERQLAEDLGISRITVRKAIDGLVAEGLLVSRQGAGNFVSTRIEKNFAKLTSFSEDMRARGRNPRSVWLKRAEGTVTPEESLKLALSPGTLVYRFHRLRFADDEPMAIEFATIDGSCLPSLEAVDASLYDALEAAGNRPVRALQRLHALLLNA